MTTFAQAINSTPITAYTNNGATTLASSLNAMTDLFFIVGASRGQDITPQFEKAYQENSDLAIRLLAWARDVRGGAGERQTFRNILQYLEKTHPESVYKILPAVPFYGRWDDLLCFKTEELRNAAFGFIAHALLDEKDGLCAKWMPRQATKTDNTAYQLRQFMGLNPKQYRQLLVSLTNVVEQKMCAKDWTNIDFSKLPSLASARYNKAFGRNAAEQYALYKEKLASGEAKINANAVYPHDVLKTMKVGGDVAVALAQWEALPNFLGDDFILPMADVSGSMTCLVGGSTSLSCMDVSIALGLYLADKQIGAFKDMVLTFSGNPQLEILKGNVYEKMQQLAKADWEMNTDLQKAFDRVLEVAVKGKVPQEQMPKYLLILSDMEFDSAKRGHETNFEVAAAKFEAAGYALPKIVFWNLHARAGNVPVAFNQEGVALVSGFSPSLLKAVLGAKTFTPQGIMLEALMDERYDLDKVANLNQPKKMKM
jgi:hypothetical protein